MKKTTLFAAVAALTATSAIAAAPKQQVNETKFEKTVAELSTINYDARVATKATITDRVEITEGEDVTVDAEVSYVPAANAFYSGFYPTRSSYKVSVGFTGIRNAIGFQNMSTEADAFTWTFGKVVGLNDEKTDYIYEDITSNEVNGYLTCTPGDMYTFPTLTATYGTEEMSYTASTGYMYHCGSNPAEWGWNNIEDEENYDYTALLGVSPCTALPGATLFPEFCITRPEATDYDETRYNANGASVNWEQGYSDETETVSDVKIKAFGTYIPQMPSPYQLNAMWAWINTVEAKAAVSLPVKVYTLTEEGKLGDVIGVGELNFPEGAFAMDVMPATSLYAVDEEGYAIEAPVCVPTAQPVMVCIEGLDNENIISFDLVANPNATYPVAKKDISKYLFPNHAYTFVDCTVTAAGEEPVVVENAMLSAPYRYYTDATYSSLMNCSDFDIYFDVNFPVVANPVDNTANFSVEVAAEGSEVVVPVYCDYIINSLVDEMLVTVEAPEWLTVTPAFNEETLMTDVTIAVAANEGEAREGAVEFKGFGIDFEIEVAQAANEAGIEGIEVKPSAKGTKYFDLQGRQLQAAPATGMYIESVNGVATKQIAR